MTDEQQDWLRALIDGFCGDPLRKALHDEVEQSTPIAFTPSEDEHWCSGTQGGRTTIYFSSSSRPEAALAHELLHARLKIRGYRQYGTSVSLTPKRYMLKRVLEILDNDLQHHKFFPEFIALGFRANEMYMDSDEFWAKQLTEQIEQLAPNQPLELFFNSFVTLVAPGGFGTDEERKTLEQMIQQRCAPGYWKRLRGIKSALAEFRDSASMDAAHTIARVVRELGDYEPAWIGFNMDFPSSGVFVGRSFTLEEAAAYANDRNQDSGQQA